MGETQRPFPTGFQEVLVFSGCFRVHSTLGMLMAWVSWKQDSQEDCAQGYCVWVCAVAEKDGAQMGNVLQTCQISGARGGPLGSRVSGSLAFLSYL